MQKGKYISNAKHDKLERNKFSYKIKE